MPWHLSQLLLRESSFCKEQSTAVISLKKKDLDRFIQNSSRPKSVFIPSARDAALLSVKDLHAAVCITSSFSLESRVAHGPQNVIAAVTFSWVLLPSCTKHGLHMQSMQTITKPCTTPHWRRKSTESGYNPTEILTWGKVSVTTFGHTTTHMHLGEPYRESRAHDLLKSETEIIPFLILSRSYSWFRLNLDLWN